MNLENKHGSNESLMQVFQRALTYNDPKTVNLQLVGIYERSEQYKVRMSCVHVCVLCVSCVSRCLPKWLLSLILVFLDNSWPKSCTRR